MSHAEVQRRGGHLASIRAGIRMRQPEERCRDDLTTVTDGVSRPSFTRDHREPWSVRRPAWRCPIGIAKCDSDTRCAKVGDMGNS